MLIFTHNNMELEYHPALKLAEIRWVGILHLQDLALLWLKTVAEIDKYEIELILLDASNVAVENSPQIDGEMIKKYFSENFPIPAVKKIARVSAGAPTYDAQMAGIYQKFLEQNNSTSVFANFHHHYEAMDWLTDHA
ncbi:hypothetical protein [Adhaeribacter pallidiroseus]|uniref:STAS/SEC14 domain-containing protein n=1 Tax=Adhaeribacter pallidiroseus TaxID=2072847 RepID=A0A369QH41_9BACT|nr:hypothetical protein [Adhaeribacter pallidiroseus]RDC63600.1 hypothetical protein AHMF7616_02205 [Adhaeribacter pallidiroseus]